MYFFFLSHTLLVYKKDIPNDFYLDELLVAYTIQWLIAD